MIIVAIRVMALVLLVLGLWHVFGALYQADLYLWNFAFDAPTTKLVVDGNAVDVSSYLTDRAIYGGAMTGISCGFLFIARRITAKRL